MAGGSIPVYGNLNDIVISNPTLTNANGVPILSFNAAGPAGSQGHMTLVVPKSMVPSGTTPAVFVNGQQVALAGTPIVQQCLPLCPVADFSQDASSYFIRITMHFSTNAVQIQFEPSSSNATAFITVNGTAANSASKPSPNSSPLVDTAVGLLIVFGIPLLIVLLAYSRLRGRRRKGGAVSEVRPRGAGVAAGPAGYCANCGQAAATGEEFCTNCGASLTRAVGNADA